MEQLTISGNWSIAPGYSATYKAAAAPTNANNKGVIWSLVNAPEGVTISTSGTVKVASYVAAGNTFTVRAVAKDGFGTSASYSVRVVPKCTTIYARAGAYNGMAKGPVTNSSGYVTTVHLFNVDVPDDNNYADNQIQLTGYARNASNQSTMAQWSSSNPSVASVSSSGLVTAHKSGTAKIYLTAMDGSGKKATITVKVTVPASSISITSSLPRMQSWNHYLAIGKSAKNSVSFADTYGKPTNKKVTWDFVVQLLVPNGEDLVRQDVTDEIKNAKWISISSNGTLTTKAGIQNFSGLKRGELLVSVIATTTDGTNVSASESYVLSKPTKKIQMLDKSFVMPTADLDGALFYCDQRFPFDDPYYCDFIVTSSNSKVASSVKVVPATDDYDNVVPGYYFVVFATGEVKGTATITVKTADGTNKSCSFKVTVK